MSYPQPMPGEEGEKKGLLLRGIADLEKGFFYQIISSLLLAIATVILLTAVGTFLLTNPEDIETILKIASTSIVAAGVVAILGLIISIVGFIKILNGFKTIGAADNKYSIGATGVKLLVAGIILALLGMIIILPGAMAGSVGAILGGIGLLGLGGLLLVIGAILMIVALWRLSDLEEGSLIKIGVILLIVGALISQDGGSLLTFIGTILVYMGLRKIREKLEAEVSQSQPAAPQPL